MEHSPAFSYQRIREALTGRLSPDELSAEEHEVYFEAFAEQMRKPPSAEDEAAFIQLLGEGPLVGLDDDDNLVYRQS